MAVFCAQCGKESQNEARYCSACGNSIYAAGSGPQQTYAPFPPVGELTRPRVGRKVAGVCQGIANHYRWDVSVIRIVMLMLAIFLFPVGLVIYGLVWLVAPEEALALPASTTYVSQG